MTPSNRDSPSHAGSAGSGNPAQSPTAAPEPASSPRAFAIGTGYVCQVLGFAMAMATCVLWSCSGWIVARVPEPPERWADYVAPQYAISTAAMLGVALSLVSGLALVAVGTGLQGEKRRSGRWAMWTTAIAGLSYLAVSALLVTNGFWIRAAVPLILAAVMTVMFLLAGHSAAVLREHPPPEDQSIVTEEWLEEQRRRRARAREGVDD